MMKTCTRCEKSIETSLDEFGDPRNPLCQSCWLKPLPKEKTRDYPEDMPETEDIPETTESPQNEKPKFAYLAIHKCGYATAISVDSANTLERKESLADYLSEWIMDDCVIEHLTLDQANERFQKDFGLCKCLVNDEN
jgi:hypothetical protein